MNQSHPLRIEIQAVRALAEWKAIFADQVAVKAKEFARASDTPGIVTLAHYRQAASIAVQELAAEVQKTDVDNGQQEAA